MAAVPGNTYGALQMLSKRLMVSTTTVMFAHADLAAQCSSTYRIMLETTTSVTQVFKITGGVVYSIQTTPSGMDRAAACNLTAAASTPLRGFVRNSPTLPCTDDIEVRICADQGYHNEDSPIELIEIYVQ